MDELAHSRSNKNNSADDVESCHLPSAASHAMLERHTLDLTGLSRQAVKVLMTPTLYKYRTEVRRLSQSHTASLRTFK